MKKIVFVAAAAVTLAGTGTAIALRATTPQVVPVTATFHLDLPTTADHHECQGVDGYYDSFHVVYPGTQTGSIPQLSGDVTFDERGLVNVYTYDGQFSGTWTLTDPNTGQLKGRGTVTGVLHGADAKGLIVATVGKAGRKLVANFASQTNENYTQDGEFGADPTLVTSDLSVVSIGSCL